MNQCQAALIRYSCTVWFTDSLRALSPRGRGGGGGTLIFSYIRRLGSFFWFEIYFEFQYIFGFFQKNVYFLGYEDFVNIFFGVTTKLDNNLGSFLCILWYFLKVKVENGDIFWVVKSHISFWGV